MPVLKEEVVDLKPASSDVLYPEITVHLAVGEDAIDVEQAKELLGWEEETDANKFGLDYATTTLAGVKVRLNHNTRNRPLQESWVDALAQEHLMRRWRLNGETIVIGRSGEVLSAQHRLISLIRAEERRTSVDEEEHWKQYWDGPVTMESVIVFGIDDTDDDVVNTIDRTTPRTIGDVFYRSQEFQRFPRNARKAMARAMDHAVRLMWHRTGRGEDAFSPTRTHAEAVAFLRDHPKLLDLVAHVAEEDGKEKRITQYVSLGYASALAYLFAASGSDRSKYEDGGRREEALGLTKKRVDQAQDFFALVGTGPELLELRKALERLDDKANDDVNTLTARCTLFVKAWNFWSAGETVTAKRIELEIETIDDVRRLTDRANCGGIDLGNDPEDALKDDEDRVAEPSEDAKRQIEDAKREVKKESIAATRDDKKPTEDEYDEIRAKHPKHVLWFEGKDSYSLFGPDADSAHEIVGCKYGPKVNGRASVKFPKNSHVPAMTAFNEAGREVAIARKTDDGVKVERIKPIVAAKAKKPAKK